MFSQWEPVGGQHLSENLGGDFEVSMVVEVLEEAFGIKSVFADDFLEVSNDFLHNSSFFISWLLAAVVSFSAGIIQHNVNRLFKLFLGKDLVNLVGKHLPLNVLALFWRLEVFS